ncbi:MAG: hypothetical protein ACM3SW_13710 [Actinomycetota bacterium]
MRNWILLYFIVPAVLFAVSGCGGNPSSSAGTPVTSASPAPSPTPSGSPTNATVLSNVEDSPKWLTCGACGNSGGTGSVANFSFTIGMPAPSEDGQSTQFAISPSVAFTNAYFYRQQTAIPQQINSLAYAFDLYIPVGMEKAPQAIEFECQQVLDGWVYNFSWQADYPLSEWRIFDYGLKRWDATPLNFTHFTPGTWHHVVAEYHNDTTAHTVIHDALTIDGVRFPVNITHNAFFSGGGNQFTNAVQLDSNSTATPYDISVDQMTITYK